MIAATQKNINWLLDRLYETSRELEASQVNVGAFVLLTKSREDRRAVERMFVSYFYVHHGVGGVNFTFDDYHESKGSTYFNMPHIPHKIVLMDIEAPE